MKTQPSHPIRFVAGCVLWIAASVAFAQPAPRGTVVVYPVVFDGTGSPTSREKATSALNEVLKKGGFRVVDGKVAAKAWQAKGFRTPTNTRPPTARNLVELGKAIGTQYVVTSTVSFHTRSIWVNLGPKTISTCTMVTTIVDSRSGEVVLESDTTGRSDEKTDGLKAAASLLISPLVTAVSGGPKTPQETRAAQIAAARSLQKFVQVEDDSAEYVGTWQWVRFDGMDDQIIKVDDPAKYVLTLSESGAATGQVDVNQFTGKYTSEGAAIKFGPLATTRVAVRDGSLHDKFLQGLRDTSSYVLRDGMLYLALKADAGIMVFRKAK